MTRRKTTPKTFVTGDIVEIQRDTGHSKPWERATYDGKLNDMRGWHRVKLPEGRGRYIDSMSGMEVTGDDPRAFLSHTLIVPTQRIRAPESR